jgi:hypothetical protein
MSGNGSEVGRDALLLIPSLNLLTSSRQQKSVNILHGALKRALARHPAEPSCECQAASLSEQFVHITSPIAL